MADAMVKLNEDDLLKVIQLIHDKKSEDTYTRHDMDKGEFSVDLFSMPDDLCKDIWDFFVSNIFPLFHQMAIADR